MVKSLLCASYGNGAGSGMCLHWQGEPMLTRMLECLSEWLHLLRRSKLHLWDAAALSIAFAPQVHKIQPNTANLWK